MKQIRCEMCGSTDLIKQDGVYVCQACGCKYTVEEAKKLMVEVEGTVDVSGSTVKVDNSDELENLYQIARRAKNENNSENAAKYYEMILVKDPNSWEASFYTAYFKAVGCRIIDIESTAITFSNSIYSVVALIKKYVNEPEQIQTIDEMAARSTNLGEMLFNGAVNYYKGLSYDTKPQHNKELANRIYAVSMIFATLGDSVESLFGGEEEFQKYYVMSWELVVNMRTAAKQYNPGIDNIIIQYTNKIKKYEPSYNSNNQTQTQQSQTPGGCYIATAVYGSYDCPQVWILRRYRDSVLACSKLGRAFIKLYYAISPTLVKWFGQTKAFKKIWRNLLDRIVRKLKDKGVEDTPYNDIDW